MKRYPQGLTVLPMPWFTYGVAVLLTAAAFSLTQESPLRNSSPFLLFFAAIIMSTRYGGLGPGLVAGPSAVAATTFFFFPPIGSFLVENSDDILRLGVFALIALMASWLIAAQKQARDLARTQAKQQATLAEIGRYALTGHDRSAILEQAAMLLHQAFDVEYAGIFEILPDGKSLLLQTGCGWQEGQVGRALIRVNADSFVKSVLASQEPTILRERHAETRQPFPRLLTDHQVIAGLNAVVPPLAS